MKKLSESFMYIWLGKELQCSAMREEICNLPLQYSAVGEPQVVRKRVEGGKQIMIPRAPDGNIQTQKNNICCI